MRNIYLVNYNPDKDIALVIDGQPKMLGPKKTETIMADDVTIRIAHYQMAVVTVDRKAPQEEGD